jgi:hypothetical protein
VLASVDFAEVEPVASRSVSSIFIRRAYVATMAWGGRRMARSLAPAPARTLHVRDPIRWDRGDRWSERRRPTSTPRC